MGIIYITTTKAQQHCSVRPVHVWLSSNKAFVFKKIGFSHAPSMGKCADVAVMWVSNMYLKCQRAHQLVVRQIPLST